MDEIKTEELRVLVEFRDFCDMHHLKYSLAFGTLLGAVRHHGFIPWDDDIDVMMLREDYEKLIQLYPDNFHNTRLLAYKKDPSYIYPFMKIISTKTYVEEARTQKSAMVKNLGVWIDIFPVDNIPDHPSRMLWWWRRFLQKCFYCKKEGIKRFTNHGRLLARRSKYMIYCVFYSLEDIRSQIDNQMSKYFGRKTKYVANVVFANGKNSILREAWDDLGLREFEGYKFTTFNDKYCDIYLTQAYGSDYMTPPPPDKRIPHGMIAFWRED